MNNIRSEKKKIRKEIKMRLKNLTAHDFNLKSEKVLEQLVKLPEWQKADTVLIFLSLQDEIKTDIIIKQALSEEKKTAVPRIKDNDLVFHIIESLNSDFNTHKLGMDEPDETFPVITPQLLKTENTLIIVPGLAYDKNCFRLGRGKGFYDRFLSSVEDDISKIGIGYDFQIIESVPVEDHDFPLDMVITDNFFFKS